MDRGSRVADAEDNGISAPGAHDAFGYAIKRGIERVTRCEKTRLKSCTRSTLLSATDCDEFSAALDCIEKRHGSGIAIARRAT